MDWDWGFFLNYLEGSLGYVVFVIVVEMCKYMVGD